MQRRRRSRLAPTIGLLPAVVAAPSFAAVSEPAATEAAATKAASWLSTFTPVLPGDEAAGVRVEAGLLCKDLRVHATWAARRRATQMQTRAGTRFFAPGVQREAVGVDLFAELVRILELMTPAGAPDSEHRSSPGSPPVPAAVVVYTYPGGAAIQGLVRVSPGFLDRVVAFQNGRGKAPSAWQGRARNGRLEIVAGGQTLLGVVGADGWLRLAPNQTMLHAAGDGAPLFGDTVRRWAAGNDSVVFVRGGGVASFALGSAIHNPTLRELVTTMNVAVLSWRFDGDKTVAAELLLDSPQLPAWRRALRRSELRNHLVDLWDESVTAFVCASLPQPILDAVVSWAEQSLRDMTPEVVLPEPLRAALAEAEGRVGVAWFGAPGDWVVALELADAEAAETAVPAFEPWAAALAKKSASDLRCAYTLENFLGLMVFSGGTDLRKATRFALAALVQWLRQ